MERIHDRPEPGPAPDAVIQVSYKPTSPGGRRSRRSRRPTLSQAFKLFQVPLDGAFGYCIFTAMLFVQQLGSLAGLAITVLPLAYAFFRWRTYGQALGRSWLLFVFPLFALGSTLWSDYPEASARYGAELIITVMGAVAVVSSRQRHALLKGVMLAFATYAVASVAFGRYVDVGMGGSGNALVGLGDGKNMMADIASIGLLASFSIIAISIRQRSIPWGLIALASAALDSYIIVMAKSAGAVIGLSAALFAMAGVVIACAMSRPVRIGFLTVLVASAAVFACVFKTLAATLLNIGMSAFNKDPTLTGRTYLWYRADDLIAQHPALGRGYSAFWQQGNPDAEGLWQFAGITSRAGFNFHNTATEILVEIGYVGLVIFLLTMGLGLWGLLRHYVNRPSLVLAFWFGFVAYVLTRAPFEALGTGAFYYSTLLMFAAAGMGMQQAFAPARAGRPAVASAVLRRRAHSARRAVQHPRWGSAPV